MKTPLVICLISSMKLETNLCLSKWLKIIVKPKHYISIWGKKFVGKFRHKNAV